MATVQPLGRRVPSDWRHVDRYRLTAITAPTTPTPVIAGTNWYTGFDTPVWDMRGGFWYLRGGDIGSVRGGHAFCLKPDHVLDTIPWWHFYDQGSEGACVGFACSRAMTLLNRQRYDAFWLYRSAQAIDEWADTPPEEGTSVRAALDILRTAGHRRVWLGKSWAVEPSAGIAVNRWATSVDDAVAAMQSPRFLGLGRVPFLNSWGTGYPHIVWMPLDVLDRLLREDGELGVIVDK